MKPRFFKRLRDYYNLLMLYEGDTFPRIELLGTEAKFKKREKVRSCAFACSTKRLLWKFHVKIVQ